MVLNLNSLSSEIDEFSNVFYVNKSAILKLWDAEDCMMVRELLYERKTKH